MVTRSQRQSKSIYLHLLFGFRSFEGHNMILYELKVKACLLQLGITHHITNEPMLLLKTFALKNKSDIML